MKSKQLDSGASRSFALVCESGEEAMASLQRFARAHDLSAAHFTGIGAFAEAVLGFFDVAKEDYRRNTMAEQVEIVPLVGDATLGEKPGEITVHAHLVLGKSNGAALGGHLIEAHVRPILEIVLTTIAYAAE